MAIKSIVLIGAGNVATQLAKILHQKGFNILQVWSRTKTSAQKIATLVDAEAITDLSQLSQDADLYLISIPDDAIGSIISQLKPLHGIIAHTSGALALAIFKDSFAKSGVFYPLQTFSKIKEVDFSTIPVCIEASDIETENSLMALASKISDDVRQISSAQRANIHLAAVFACNFANYMYFLGEDFLKQKGIAFDILIPLIIETAEKIKHQNPRDAQTGPGIRHDKKTITRHLEMLKSDPEKFELYQLISNALLKQTNK